MATTIHALIFDVECTPPASGQLVVWLDEHGNSKHTQHSHPNKTMIDVEVGHVVIHQHTQYVVTGIRPYRTSLCKDESQYPVSPTVRDVLDGLGW